MLNWSTLDDMEPRRNERSRSSSDAPMYGKRLVLAAAIGVLLASKTKSCCSVYHGKTPPLLSALAAVDGTVSGSGLPTKTTLRSWKNARSDRLNPPPPDEAAVAAAAAASTWRVTLLLLLVQPKTINATADQAGGAAAIHRGGKRHQELKIVGNFSSILFWPLVGDICLIVY